MTSMKVKLKYADVETFIARYAVNLTRGGVFIATPSPKPVGTLLRFEFVLTGTPSGRPLSVLRGEGQVQWTQPYDESAPDRPYGMGVRFLRLDEESQEVVDRALATRFPEVPATGVGRPGPKAPVQRRQTAQPIDEEQPARELFAGADDETAALQEAQPGAAELAGVEPEPEPVTNTYERPPERAAKAPEATPAPSAVQTSAPPRPTSSRPDRVPPGTTPDAKPPALAPLDPSDQQPARTDDSAPRRRSDATRVLALPELRPEEDESEEPLRLEPPGYSAGTARGAEDAAPQPRPAPTEPAPRHAPSDELDRLAAEWGVRAVQPPRRSRSTPAPTAEELDEALRALAPARGREPRRRGLSLDELGALVRKERPPR
jgi:uncharacterized protein (TIGR02266 family)